jgi:hypothetical protein
MPVLQKIRTIGSTFKDHWDLSRSVGSTGLLRFAASRPYCFVKRPWDLGRARGWRVGLSIAPLHQCVQGWSGLGSSPIRLV